MPEAVDQYKNVIRKAFREQAKAPLALLAAFNQYEFLFESENEEALEAFINKERTWDELAQETKTFHQMAQDIQITHDSKVQVGIFDVFCDELVRSLSDRAINVRDKIIEKMIHELHGLLKG